MKELCKVLEYLFNQYYFLKKRIEDLHIKQLEHKPEKDPYNLLLIGEYNGKLDQVLICLGLLGIKESKYGLKLGKFNVVLESQILTDTGNYIVINKDGAYFVQEIVEGVEGIEVELYRYKTLEDLIEEHF